MRLSEKVAVVIGGAGAIGAAIAERFALEGAKVAIADVVHAAEIVARIEEHGGEAFCLDVDVTGLANAKRLMEEIIRRLGHIDVLVNSAGISLTKRILDVSEPELDHILSVNVKGVVASCAAALPYLLLRGGAIINLSSNAGLLGRADDPVYAATKHAVVGLTKSLALAYAQNNVRVNALCPGPIDTPMMWAGAVTDEERRARLPSLLASCPAARYASTEEVAQAALFLASDESRFISGVALAIDGGKAAGIMPIERYRLDFPINA